MNAKSQGERKAISAVFGKGGEEGKIKRKTNNLTDEQISAKERKRTKKNKLLEKKIVRGKRDTAERERKRDRQTDRQTDIQTN